MTKMVIVLFDSREEAELAGTRLVSDLKGNFPRIIGADTIAAVDDLKISPKDAQFYREQLRGRAHLLAAEVPSGASPARILELLDVGAGTTPGAVRDETHEPKDGALLASSNRQKAREKESEIAPPARKPLKEVPRDELASGSESIAPPLGRPLPLAPERDLTGADPGDAPGSATAERATADPSRELRVGPPQVASTGARVRTFTREVGAEERTTLRDQVIEIEMRTSERHLSEDEIEAGGLFKERVLEATETREEPVVTKIPVVREEVIVRKTVKERTETVHETVRRTEVEVEDLPASEAAALFGPQVDNQLRSTSADRGRRDGITERGSDAAADEQARDPEQATHSSGWF